MPSTAGSRLNAAAMLPRPRASPPASSRPRPSASCMVRCTTARPDWPCPAARERANRVCAATARESASRLEASQTCQGGFDERVRRHGASAARAQAAAVHAHQGLEPRPTAANQGHRQRSHPATRRVLPIRSATPHARHAALIPLAQPMPCLPRWLQAPPGRRSGGLPRARYRCVPPGWLPGSTPP